VINYVMFVRMIKNAPSRLGMTKIIYVVSLTICALKIVKFQNVK